MRVLIACEYSGRVRDAFAAKGHDAWSCDLLPTDTYEQEGYGKHYQGDVLDIIDGWIPVAYAHDMLECDMCDEPFCPECGVHYHECSHPGPHQDDEYEYKEVGDILLARPMDNPHWDLMIAHPTCTYLTCSAEWAYADLPIMIKGKQKKLNPEKLYGPARREARDNAAEFFTTLYNAPIKKLCIENPVGVMSTRLRKADQTIQPYEYGDDASKRTCLWLRGLPPLIAEPANRKQGRIVEYPIGSGKMVERWGNQTDSGQSNLTPSEDRWKTRSYTYQGWADAMASQWG